MADKHFVDSASERHGSVDESAHEVVLLIPDLSQGVRYWFHTAEAVRSCGVRTLIATLIPPEQGTVVQVDLLLPEFWLSRRLRAALRWTGLRWFGPGGAWTVVRRRPRAVICVEYGLCTLWTVLFGRFLRVPVWIFHEHVRRESVLQGRCARWIGRLDPVLCRLVSRLASGVIANTSEAREQALTQYRVSVPVVHIPLLTVPRDIRRGAAAARRDPDDPAPRPLVVGFVGQLIHRKGVDVLLRATARARAEGAALHVRIAGQGPEMEALRRLSGALGIDEVVRFCGPVPYDRVGAFLGECDVLVLPTRFDYRAVVVLEALACGVPVITTTADGNAGTTVRDGVNGYVVPPEDPEALADRLAQLAADRALVRRLAAGAAATPIPTPEQAAERLVALVSGAASGSREEVGQ